MKTKKIQKQEKKKEKNITVSCMTGRPSFADRRNNMGI